MRIDREEIFGPVLSVMRFADGEEAVRMAIDPGYTLAAGQ
ncbi:MAG: aldehyde dehydrogenase family protein [Pseudomonadota bacterium]